jgi:hypothetical protein
MLHVLSVVAAQLADDRGRMAIVWFGCMQLRGVQRILLCAPASITSLPPAALQVVGDSTTFHTLAAPPRDKPSQVDKNAGILRGPPVKPGLAVSYAPPAPASMYIGTGWASPSQAVQREVQPDKWLAGPGRDFELYSPGQRNPVAKPGFSDSISAALHDKGLGKGTG